MRYVAQMEWPERLGLALRGLGATVTHILIAMAAMKYLGL